MGALAIANLVASVVPGLARWLGGDKAGDVADQVVNVAKKVTGLDDGEAAAKAIQQDPELQIKLQHEMAPILIAQYESETKRLETVNQTMQAEATSGDPYVRRWRPSFGYAVTLTWAMQMLAVSILIVWKPDKAASVMTALVGLTGMWGIALSILGINVSKRSQDKLVAAGKAPAAGIIQALASRIAGGK